MKDYVDEKLAAMLQDVLVPEGLSERLLERLNQEEQGTKNLSQNVAQLPSAVQISSARPRAAVPQGRRLMLIGGLSATAAGLLIAVWLGMGTTEKYSEQYVLNESIRMFDAAAVPSGFLLTEKPAPNAYPFSEAVLPARGMRWRFVDGFIGDRGVRFDLPGPAGARAALYVVNIDTVAGLGTGPTQQKPFSTAGCCASAWQENGMLYVLVVQGDPATYRTYLNLPQRPVAFLRAVRRHSPLAASQRSASRAAIQPLPAAVTA